jgi:hypothetical protein
MHKIESILRLNLTLGLLILAGLATGCATNKVDWQARVGTYTFDQCVIELGPPIKQAKLTDGTLVAEWETQRGYSQTTYVGGGYYGRRGYYGGYAPMPVTSSYPSYFLRLTFGQDGKLQSWKRVAL